MVKLTRRKEIVDVIEASNTLPSSSLVKEDILELDKSVREWMEKLLPKIDIGENEKTSIEISFEAVTNFIKAKMDRTIKSKTLNDFYGSTQIPMRLPNLNLEWIYSYYLVPPVGEKIKYFTRSVSVTLTSSNGNVSCRSESEPWNDYLIKEMKEFLDKRKNRNSLRRPLYFSLYLVLGGFDFYFLLNYVNRGDLIPVGFVLWGFSLFFIYFGRVQYFQSSMVDFIFPWCEITTVPIRQKEPIFEKYIHDVILALLIAIFLIFLPQYM